MGGWTLATAAAMALATAIAGPAAEGGASGYKVLKTIPGPDGGWDYARIDTVNDRLLVTRGGAVMAVDLATDKITSGLAPGARQHVALPVDGGAEMLVTNGGTNSAVFADARTGATLASLPTGAGPDSAILDAASGLALVMGHAGGDVTLIDPAAHKVVGDIAIGGKLEEAASDGHGRAFVAVEDRNEVAVLDIAGRKVAARYALPGCDGPTGLAYDGDDRLIIAACDGTTDLVAADTGAVVGTLATGKGADGAVYDPQRRLAFVPAGRDGTLAVIAFDGGKGHIAGLTPTQKGARTIALDPRTGRLYLPSAEYRLAPDSGRPTPVPGTFQIIVVGR
ncbi:MAG: YncE family protein [Proteobacteria bacterium]|nr:YncE family protein [Pseudomonadota bacterium]